MADIRIRNAFGFPIAHLQNYCRRFDFALADEAVGGEVCRHLPPDFPRRFKDGIDRLGELEVLQSAAQGRAGELTQAKRDAVADVILLSGSARRAARVEFARDPAVLHGEFFVGGHHSKSIATLISNAQKLVENCAARSAALAPHGWSPAETQLLAAALETLKQADVDQEAASDLKEGYTAEQTALANDLYRMCRAIQNVARVVYAPARVAANPSLVAGRAKFMLGEFPRRGHSKQDASETPASITTPPPTTAESAATAGHPGFPTREAELATPPTAAAVITPANPPPPVGQASCLTPLNVPAARHSPG